MHQPHKKRRIRLSVILAAVLLLFLGLSYFIGSQVVEASTHLVTNEETMENYLGSWELEGFDYERFQSAYEIEELSIPSSFDDHSLPFDILSDEHSENVVVMAHGMLGNRLTNYPTAEIFLEHGFRVISYDQRSSGKNMAERSTFGCWEKYDLIDCIRYARTHFPEAEIVVWGESFGGATALLGVASEGVQEDVSALILDCPVSSMSYMIESELSKLGMPLPTGYLMVCGDLVNRLKLGFSYADADGVTCAEQITVPTLIFNSKADEITPVSMGQDLYDHLASEKKVLCTSETSGHIEIRNHERDRYVDCILDILP